MFEPEVFRKQMMYSIEEIICDIVGTFRRPPQSSSALPQRFGARGIFPPLTSLVTALYVSN